MLTSRSPASLDISNSSPRAKALWRRGIALGLKVLRSILRSPYRAYWSIRRRYHNARMLWMYSFFGSALTLSYHERRRSRRADGELRTVLIPTPRSRRTGDAAAPQAEAKPPSAAGAAPESPARLLARSGDRRRHSRRPERR